MGLDIALYANSVVKIETEHKTRIPMPDKHNVIIAHWMNRWELYSILNEMYKEYDADHLSLDQTSYLDKIKYCMLLDRDDINYLTDKITAMYYSENLIAVNDKFYTNYLYESNSMLEFDLSKLEIARLNMYGKPANAVFAHWSY